MLRKFTASYSTKGGTLNCTLKHGDLTSSYTVTLYVGQVKKAMREAEDGATRTLTEMKAALP